jgi:hypothetical protein
MTTPSPADSAHFMLHLVNGIGIPSRVSAGFAGFFGKYVPKK